MYRYIHTHTHTNTHTRALAQGHIESKSCRLVCCSDSCTQTNTEKKVKKQRVKNKSTSSWPVFESATHYTATHCNTLQRTATHCNAPQHTATHCNILHHTATHCIKLLHTATHCSILQHSTTHCNTLQHITTHSNTQQHSTTHCKHTHGVCYSAGGRRIWKPRRLDYKRYYARAGNVP